MRRNFHCVGMTAISMFVLMSAVRAEDPPAAASVKQAGAGKTPGRLSDQALAWLASGVALYPDPVLEKVFEAAQTPADIRRAVTLRNEGSDLSKAKLPESINYLAENYPGTLDALNGKPGLTELLGKEFVADPARVWNTVEKVRGQIEERKAKAAPAPASACRRFGRQPQHLGSGHKRKLPNVSGAGDRVGPGRALQCVGGDRAGPAECNGGPKTSACGTLPRCHIDGGPGWKHGGGWWRVGGWPPLQLWSGFLPERSGWLRAPRLVRA